MAPLEGYKRLTEAAKEIPNFGEDSLRRMLRLHRVEGMRVGRDWWLKESEIQRLAKQGG